MKNVSYLIIAVFVCSVSIFGCGGADKSTTSVINNNIPIASAGSETTVAVGDTVILSAESSTDPDENTLSYLWSVVSFPSVTPELSSASSVTTSFTAGEIGEYEFKVDVSDAYSSVSATTKVIAEDLEFSNCSPANGATNVSTGTVVGCDFNGHSPNCNYTLVTDGVSAVTNAYGIPSTSYSFGALLTNTQYHWTIACSNGSYASFKESSLMSFTTSSVATNMAPTAVISSSQTVNVGTTAYASCTGTDPEGSTVTPSMSMAVPSGSYATLVTASSGSYSVTPDIAGTYTLSCKVNDGIQDSPTVQSTITALSSDGTSTTVESLPLSGAVLYQYTSGRATWNSSTGALSVLQSGANWNVQLIWYNFDVTLNVQRTVKFNCSGGNNVTVVLLDASNYTTYAESTQACNGAVTANLLPNTSSSNVNLSLQFGAASGTYTISNVTIE